MRNKHIKDPCFTHTHTHTHKHTLCTELQIRSSCDRSQISALRLKDKRHWIINYIPEAALKKMITSHNGTQGDFRVVEIVVTTISQNLQTLLIYV